MYSDARDKSQVRYDRAKKHEILHLLEEHITENIVKVQKAIAKSCLISI